MNKRSLMLWGLYGAFVAWAIYEYWTETTLEFGGPLGGIKAVVWVALVGFLIYSVYCSMNEDLFRSIGAIWKLYWGRQIGTDLYLGLLVGVFVIYLNEGAVAALIWLVPTLAFANLSILLYVALNFDSLVAAFR